MKVHVNLETDPKLILSKQLLLSAVGYDETTWIHLCKVLQVPEDTTLVELTYNSKIIKAYNTQTGE